MCGGLVVTYTASAQGQAGPWLPHLLYNLGRLLSYVAVGAILGAFGSFFGIRPAFSGALTLVVGVLMIAMGLGLLTEWSWLRGASAGPLNRVAALLFSGAASPRGPFVIGLLNGLMPCGPLQAMQLYALSTGSPVKGALAMGVYALGTIPMMLGFGRVLSLISKGRVKAVLRLSGAVVVVMGLLMISRGWVSLSGAAAPTPVAEVNPAAAASSPEAFQTVTMYVTASGYEPNTLNVKLGIPVRWLIEGKQLSRCTDEIILPEYDIRQKLHPGTNLIEFTPTRTGEIRFSCWMKMVWGRFIVS
jgi:sulfite exporter TauE/SafE